jgi:VWFA-related protein
VCALTGGLVAGRAQQAPFRASVDLVNIGVTVADRRGDLMSGLAADDFEVLEDGRPQRIELFAAGDAGHSAPELHLGLLLDVTQSMEGDIAFTRTASIRFLKTMAEAVDITLVDFDSEVRVTRFAQDDFPRLVERIRGTRVRGRTALYDAVAVYLDGAQGQAGRKVMLLYTDGGDTESALGLKGLLDLVKASDVTIYAIGRGGMQSPASRLSVRSVLHQLTEASGGLAFFPDAVRDLDAVYRRVAAEIRAQYTIGYESTNPAADGAWREVSVRLKPERRRELRDARVRARRGYFAPYRPASGAVRQP